ncbi:hypothetical protein ACIBH1_19870 [Nonomuraea sp. NPDC050663]|uniref:hypothetical protein n=1 Tax=Nonomuraea sp. NPDC050663 TaxID=3364370 RepID=UPI00378B6ECB
MFGNATPAGLFGQTPAQVAVAPQLSDWQRRLQGDVMPGYLITARDEQNPDIAYCFCGDVGADDCYSWPRNT